ncbi:MAG: DUF1648 domain-containing protein [Kiritimatiellae bacterium]|nr:DUF1648 domain-containing protein [Kiritimatiellia bacterium]
MRKLFILAFLANVALTLLSSAILPDRVATHFGSGGMADGWRSNYSNALFNTGGHVIFFCLLYFTPQLVIWFPGKWTNLPNKDYWLQPAMLPQTKAKISVLMWQLGVAIFAFMFVIGLLALHANMAKPVRLNEPVLFAALGILLAYSVWWTIAFFRAFRLPERTRGYLAI